jgi:two-component system phosphate regulon sensor histidine kinase PhoR
MATRHMPIPKLNSRWLWAGVRLAAALGGCVAVGLILGRVQAMLIVGLAGYLVWHLVNLHRLDRWLTRRDGVSPPGAIGLWGDVYDSLFRLRRRNQERKRTLKELLTRFREAAEALPDGVVLLDENQRILWFNGTASRTLGLGREDVNQPIRHLLQHPDLIAYLASDHLDEAVEIPSPRDERVQLSIRRVNYYGGQDLLLATDISRLRNLERVRRDFISNLSHELRTPLTVVIGYSESMIDSSQFEGTPWHTPIAQVKQQAARMLSIVEELLMLSRLEAGDPRQPDEPVSVPAVVEAIREDAIALSGERGHRVTLSSVAPQWLLGRERELRSAFSNLVFNAIRYTPEGGHVDIRWCLDSDGGLCLSVEDDGDGIPARYLPRLTERFYRVDVARSREAGGTGLGLAIVKHVMLRHDGRLEIASRVGEGSVFSCRFPAERSINPGSFHIDRKLAPGGGVERA